MSGISPNPSRGSALLPWIVGAAVVLTLAVTAGFMTAYWVATSRAVPTPNIALASPTPRTTAPVPSALGSGPPTAAPRRTPTAAPIITPEPSPFIHVVKPGEFLTLIAEMYGVTVEEILALNDIRNPNRIQVGQELLIPGHGTPPSPTP